MPIQVTCPGCHGRFNVSEKFAGKKGPCPKCKAEITIPLPKDEVVIHAPEEFESGGRGVTGRLALKPISRTEMKVQPAIVVAVVGAAILVFGITWMVGRMFPDKSRVPTALLAFGAIAIAPPLVFGGYTFLRDSELQPYRGVSLWVRVGACSAAYALLWGMYAVVVHALLPGASPQVFQLIFFLPPLAAIGALSAFASLDLDWTMGLVHYGLYLLVTVLLRLTLGMPPY